jgi:hypothetical protein
MKTGKIYNTSFTDNGRELMAMITQLEVEGSPYFEILLLPTLVKATMFYDSFKGRCIADPQDMISEELELAISDYIVADRRAEKKGADDSSKELGI